MRDIKLDFSDWHYAVYAPLFTLVLLVIVLFGRWAYIVWTGRGPKVMLDLIIGIVLTFLAMLVENVFYAYARIAHGTPSVPTWVFITTKKLYLVGALVHLHAVLRTMTGSWRATCRITIAAGALWLAAYLYFVLT